MTFITLVKISEYFSFKTYQCNDTWVMISTHPESGNNYRETVYLDLGARPLGVSNFFHLGYQNVQ